MAVKNGYSNLYQKVKRRDANIVKFKETIASLKRYITKVQSRSRQRALRLKVAYQRIKEEQQKTLSLSRFVNSGFDRRIYNVGELLIRFNRTLEQLKSEITHSQIFILIYLYNRESASNKEISAAIGNTTETVKSMVHELSKRELVNSRRLGASNYVYATFEGKAVAKRFIELIKKQKIDI